VISSKTVYLGKLIVFTLVTSILGTRLPANAEIYRAGEFIITIDRDAYNGRTYRGCDAKKNCIYLTQGTAWRDKGYRGISWENREYTYIVIWQEGASQAIYLKVFNPQGHLILNRVMSSNLKIGTTK
jgi:hypothetical protein